VLKILAGGSGAQRGVIVERAGEEPSNRGSAIGEEGTESSTLLFEMSLMIFDEGRELVLRLHAAARSWFLAMAVADLLKAAMSRSVRSMFSWSPL
jgi:hypothetical protein